MAHWILRQYTTCWGPGRPSHRTLLKREPRISSTGFWEEKIFPNIYLSSFKWFCSKDGRKQWRHIDRGGVPQGLPAGDKNILTSDLSNFSHLWQLSNPVKYQTSSVFTLNHWSNITPTLLIFLLTIRMTSFPKCWLRMSPLNVYIHWTLLNTFLVSSLISVFYSTIC